MPGVSVVFNADTGQFVSNVNSGTASVEKQADAVARTKNVILAATQQQLEAAKRLQATQQELERIQTQGAQKLAAVTEQNATRIAASLNRIAEKQKAVGAELENLNKVIPIDRFVTPFRDMEEGAEHALPAMAAASGAVRALEGDLTTNVRAAERFLTTTLNLGGVLAKAFPVIGAIALGSAIAKIGKEAYEALQNIVRLRGAVEQLANLQINVDKKASSLKDSVEEEIEKSLEARSGKVAALQQKYAYQQQKPIDLSDYFYSSEFKGLPNDVKAKYEEQYKSIAPADLPARLSKIRSEVSQLQQALVTVRTPGATAGGFVPTVDGVGPDKTRNPADYYAARLKAAQQLQTLVQGESDQFGAKGQGLQDETGKAQADAAEKAQRQAEEAARKREAAIRAAGAAQRRAQEDQLSALKNDHDVSSVEEDQFWKRMLVPAAKYPENLSKIKDRLGQLYQEMGREINQELGKAVAEQKRQIEALAAADRTLLDIDNQYARALHRDADALAQLSAVNQQNIDQLTQQQIAYAASTGAISKHDAALQIAALHAATYAAQLEALNKENQADDADTSLSPDQRKANQDKRSVRAAQINGEAQRTAYQDTLNITLTTWEGALKNANAAFVADARDSAKQVADLYGQAINGLNDNLSDLIVGKKANFSGYFQGLGKTIATDGLKRVEAPVLNSLGLGKADGSDASPFSVKVVGGSSSNLLSGLTSTKGLGKILGAGSEEGEDSGGDDSDSSGTSGFLSTLGSVVGSLFGGHRALGGPVQAGVTYDVGEMGREEFTPSTSGTITPHNQVNDNSSVSYEINVGEGVTGSDVDMRIASALRKAHPQSRVSAVQAMKDDRRRMPASKG